MSQALIICQPILRNKMLTQSKSKILSPLLKWAGGKSWLISKMVEIYEPYRDRVWVDPFCGSLALPLALKPKRAKLSDINPLLINLYQSIQEPEFSYLGLYQNTEKDYYKARQLFNNPEFEDDYRDAELFLYLNRTCFNGLCRFNKKGEFNVPYGKYKNPKLEWDFTEYRQLFKNWKFEVGDYKNVEISSSDFVYLDPPYDKGFTGYFGNSFEWEQQQELAGWASELTCPVVISNLATDRVKSLYKSCGFNIELLSAPRSISCNGNRERATEILATNF